jgi:hypothetical protein
MEWNMKRIILLFFVLTGCLNFAKGQWFRKEAIEARDTAYQCFVMLIDSTIIKYNKLKYRMPPLSYGYLEGDGEKLKFRAEDILCYQDLKGYWLRIVDPALSVTPIIGRYPLNDFFAYRIVRGEIEIFVRHVNRERGYFIRKGTFFKPLDEWGVGLKDLIKDNKELHDGFKITRKTDMKDAVEVAKAYNASR